MHKCPDGNQSLLCSSVIPCKALLEQNPQRLGDMGEVAEIQAQPALMPHLKKEMEISDLRFAASLGNGWKSFLPTSTAALKNKSISYQSLAGDAAGREWQPVQEAMEAGKRLPGVQGKGWHTTRWYTWSSCPFHPHNVWHLHELLLSSTFWGPQRRQGHPINLQLPHL